MPNKHIKFKTRSRRSSRKKSGGQPNPFTAAAPVAATNPAANPVANPDANPAANPAAANANSVANPVAAASPWSPPPLPANTTPVNPTKPPAAMPVVPPPMPAASSDGIFSKWLGFFKKKPAAAAADTPAAADAPAKSFLEKLFSSSSDKSDKGLFGGKTKKRRNKGKSKGGEGKKTIKNK